MSTILKVEGLRKSFRSSLSLKKHEALKGVSFEVQRGRVVGFLGANGAGKTTTLKSCLGFIHPDAGSIDFFGEGPVSESIKTRIGFLPERPYFYEYLTGDEYLKFSARLNKNWTTQELQKRVDEILELVELRHAASRQLRGYSKGMLQRIGLAQALIHDPEFIILDEPMSGLDPDGRYKINQILRETAQRGKTLFFSSHLLNDAEALCEDLVIVAHGRVIYQGTMQGLLSQMKLGYLLTFREGELMVRERFSTEGELQRRIDELRKNSLPILEIKVDQPTLESAFVKITSEAPR